MSIVYPLFRKSAGIRPEVGPDSRHCKVPNRVLMIDDSGPSTFERSNNVAPRNDADQPILLVNHRKALVTGVNHQLQDTR